VGIDDASMRLAYTLVETALPITHHNASAQVVADGPDQCTFVWTTDVLPDPVADTIKPMMRHGIGVIKATMESAMESATGPAMASTTAASSRPTSTS
jgi:hypothetical protein